MNCKVGGSIKVILFLVLRYSIIHAVLLCYVFPVYIFCHDRPCTAIHGIAPRVMARYLCAQKHIYLFFLRSLARGYRPYSIPPLPPPPHKKGRTQEQKLTYFPPLFSYSVRIVIARKMFASCFSGKSTLIKKVIKFSSQIRKIKNGAVAKSYMRKGFLIYEEMHKYLTIYEEAVSHICMTL
jgi:hypothetical protein